MNINPLILQKVPGAYHTSKYSLELQWFDAQKVALGMGKPRRLVGEKTKETWLKENI